MKKLYIIFSIVVIILLGLIACPSKKKPDKPISKQQTQQIGYITTQLEDGSFMKGTVTLWTIQSIRNDTRISNYSAAFVTTVINNEKVIILGYEGQYVHVKKSNGLSGWCLKEWIK